MRITFLGADHEVTGSCHYLQVADKNILIDCGMEQGNDVYENQELPIPACDVDYVLLTHAHIDHSGLIPLLYVNGFRGKIYCTEATVQLCDIMLRDSAHIQMFEAEWPLSFTLSNPLRAAGDVKFTMTASIISMWLFRVGSSYVLGVMLGMGVLGVWIGMFIDWAARSVCFVARFVSGRWLKRGSLA